MGPAYHWTRLDDGLKRLTRFSRVGASTVPVSPHPFSGSDTDYLDLHSCNYGSAPVFLRVNDCHRWKLRLV